jgi:hypothetical protein
MSLLPLRRLDPIITKVYGFDPESFEAKTTPREEAFWYFEPGEETKRG